MSQYPNQQYPNQGGFNYYAPTSAVDPWAQYRRPAQHAALFMFVLGGLMLMCGVCFIGLGAALPYIDLSGQDMSKMQELESELPFSMTVVFVLMGMLGFIPGLAMLVLGFFVRKAYKIPIILSIILAGLVIACILLHAVSLVIVGLSGNKGGALPGACMDVVALAAMGVLIVFLVRALKSVGHLAQAQAQYSQQYYQAYYAWQQQQAPQGDMPQQTQPPGNPTP